MQLPDTTNYLTWARDVNLKVHGPDAREGGFCDLTNSSLGEPSALLHESLQQAYANGFAERLGESGAWGCARLKEALGKRYGVAPEQVVTVTGCSAGLTLVFRALTGIGTHVLIETPRYQPFEFNAKQSGTCVTWLQRGDGGAIDLDALEYAVAADTRLLVLSNLHNPTGAHLKEPVLRGIADVARRRGFLVVVDEVYGDFAKDHVPAARLDDCFISLGSLTKVHGLGTLRCGWLIATREILRRMQEVLAVFNVGVSQWTHTLASFLLEDFGAYERHWRARLAANRPLLEKFLDEMRPEGLVEGTLPRYGGICFPRLPGIPDTASFVRWLAETHELLVVPGEFFRVPGHVRISGVGGGGELARGLERLASALRAYPGRR